MNSNWQLRTVALLLITYLLLLGAGAAILIALNFPSMTDNGQLKFAIDKAGQIPFKPIGAIQSAEQAMTILAFLAGVAGSFLHASQSLASYLGNNQFKASWATWYFLRPWIGGILGFSLYFVCRAGFVAGASATSFNPYGLVAIGILGGWFSKTTTDKLQEVFDTLFSTHADAQRKDALTP